MPSRSEPSAPLLKTCETCFHAKIRCQASPNSNKCTRCLRLNKPCFFRPCRRNKSPKKRKYNILKGGVHSPTFSPVRRHSSPRDDAINSPSPCDLRGTEDKGLYHNPFSRGLLPLGKGQDLLNTFRSVMAPFFPFVVVSETTTVRGLARTKPAQCLAILSVTACNEPKLQQDCQQLFDQLIIAYFNKEPFEALDVLQGLLISLAWSQYRSGAHSPSKYLTWVQEILPDICPIGGRTKESVCDPTLEETRARAGAYLISSRSSFLSQGSPQLPFDPRILGCIEAIISTPSAKPSDRCLPYIVRLQGLIEEIDDAMSGSNFDQNMPASPHSMDNIRRIRKSYLTVKASITFPIGASPIMYLQLQMIDLLTCYYAIENAPGILYQTIEWGFTDHQLLNSLSQAISAAKSLLDAVLYPYANPISLPVAGWEMLCRALPLAVRLDSIAAKVTDATNQLRKILDLPYVIRQIVLRLEQIIDVRLNQDGKGLFHQLRRQAGEFEQLYMESPNEHESLGSETPLYGDFYTLDPALTLTQCDEIDVMLGL